MNKDNCEICNNPKIMYHCAECENSEETGTCHLCGKTIITIDKDYHLNCNK